MERKGIQTMALPYANGDLHLGHALESIMADIAARIKRNAYDEFYFVCADDSHGTPIEINAMKQKLKPEELVRKIRERHIEDFRRFNISFDVFHDTNSPENKELAELFFNKLKEAGLIYKKSIEQFYCETDKRFLPDRFIKGTCPYCGASDQYGDVCEVCGRTYNPDEMKDYFCVLCKNKPVVRESEHYFFKLSELSEEMKSYVKDNQNLKEETKNYVMRWIEDGLKDWDISREGPYFGFKIPGEENKYFYVWLDAPIGYISSLKHLLDKKNEDYKKKWNESEIVHVIGKDIMYFHLLFWPAMLKHTGLRQPDNVAVHGFLNVDGMKMSKSRGTALTARDIADKYPTDLFRFYIASHVNNNMSDINFDEKKFADKINHELISNIFNMHYRILSLIEKRKEPIPASTEIGNYARELAAKVNEKNRLFLTEAIKFNHANAVKAMLEAGDIINKYIQDNKPWAMDDNSEILACAYALSSLTLLPIQSVMPDAYAELKRQYGIERIDEFLKDYTRILLNNSGKEKSLSNGLDLSDRTLGLLRSYADNSLFSVTNPKIIYKRMELAKEKEESDHNNKAADNNISKQEKAFSKILFRVAKVESAKKHPDADKLFILQIDVGDHKRQIVTGLVGHYAAEELEGRKIVLVDNLKPAMLRNEKSDGMLLAGSNENLGAKGEDIKVILVDPKDAEPGDYIFAEKQEDELESHIEELREKQCEFKDVIKSGITAKEGKVLTPLGFLKTKHAIASAEGLEDGCEIH